jgi:hypothetical protein
MQLRATLKWPSNALASGLIAQPASGQDVLYIALGVYEESAILQLPERANGDWAKFAFVISIARHHRLVKISPFQISGQRTGHNSIGTPIVDLAKEGYSMRAKAEVDRIVRPESSATCSVRSSTPTAQRLTKRWTLVPIKSARLARNLVAVDTIPSEGIGEFSLPNAYCTVLVQHERLGVANSRNGYLGFGGFVAHRNGK